MASSATKLNLPKAFTGARDFPEWRGQMEGLAEVQCGSRRDQLAHGEFFSSVRSQLKVSRPQDRPLHYLDLVESYTPDMTTWLQDFLEEGTKGPQGRILQELECKESTPGRGDWNLVRKTYCQRFKMAKPTAAGSTTTSAPTNPKSKATGMRIKEDEAHEARMVPNAPTSRGLILWLGQYLFEDELQLVQPHLGNFLEVWEEMLIRTRQPDGPLGPQDVRDKNRIFNQRLREFEEVAIFPATGTTGTTLALAQDQAQKMVPKAMFQTMEPYRAFLIEIAKHKKATQAAISDAFVAKMAQASLRPYSALDADEQAQLDEAGRLIEVEETTPNTDTRMGQTRPPPMFCFFIYRRSIKDLPEEMWKHLIEKVGVGDASSWTPHKVEDVPLRWKRKDVLRDQFSGLHAFGGWTPRDTPTAFERPRAREQGQAKSHFANLCRSLEFQSAHFCLDREWILACDQFHRQNETASHLADFHLGRTLTPANIPSIMHYLEESHTYLTPEERLNKAQEWLEGRGCACEVVEGVLLHEGVFQASAYLGITPGIPDVLYGKGKGKGQGRSEG